MTQRYVVVDLETTGNSLKKGDRIIQFAAVVIEGGNIIEEYSTFLNPGQQLPLFIEELTNIKQEQVDSAPSFKDIAPTVMELLKDACFVAHNVLFDLSFLHEELVEAGYPGFYGSAIDTVELAKITRPTAQSYKLAHLAADEGFLHDRPHQADSDAYATAKLFLLFKSELEGIPLVTLKQLNKLSLSLKSDISELLTSILEERMKKSPIHHPHLYIHKGIAVRKPEPDPAFSGEGDATFPVKREVKLSMLQKAFPKYEEREDQLDMMDAVYNGLSKEEVVIIEAGTGLGKTIGYLLPAAYHAHVRKEKVVISTYTIDLQNQILHKELDALKNMLPFSVRTCVLKGRSNYISMAKFDRVLRTRNDNYEAAITKMQILNWLLQTETGDKDELNLSSGGELFWEKLQDGEHLQSEHLESWRNLDFYERAKNRALHSDLIITNHAYLMTDHFTTENSIASNAAVIVDEAHHLENAALKYMGSSLDYISAKMMLNKIGTRDQRLLLHKVESMLNGKGVLKHAPKRIESLVTDLAYELEQFFGILGGVSARIVKKTGGSGENGLNLLDLLKNDSDARAIEMIAERLIWQFKDLGLLFDEVITSLMDESELGKSQLFYLTEMHSLQLFFKEKHMQIKEFFKQRKGDYLYWLEWNKNSPSMYVRLYSQPCFIGDKLRNHFFGRHKSTILTSSTIKVNGSFDFFKERLGITDMAAAAYVYKSPFNYEKQVKMLIASDLPEVNKVSNEDYARELAAYIEEAAVVSNGRMLILFTSKEMLKETHAFLKAGDKLDGFNILSQGISSNSKSRLIKYFRSYEKSILLGTASFWDGLDLPGDILKCLLLVRLPFSSPADPLTEARAKRVQEEGGSPFWDYSLPEAIMRFRQGFGRLIRTNEDKGVFIVCDKRITTTRYGEEFIASLPELKMEEVTVSQLHDKMIDWLN